MNYPNEIKILYFCLKRLYMETISKKEERVRRITNVFSKLSVKEQNELLKRLEQKIMIEKAEKLANGVLKNNLSMDDIVNEIRKVRNKQ